jgi:hypothetical protein
LFTPDQKIHDLLKNAEPEIADYVRKLEAIIAKFESDNVIADSRIANFEENIKALLSKHSNQNSTISEIDWAAAIAAAQGKVLRPKILDEDNQS